MRKAILSMIVVVAAQVSPARAQNPPADPLGQPPVTLPPQLDRVLRDYEAAWKAGDGQRLAALFTEDGFNLSSGQLPIRGRPGIANWHTKPGGELQLRAFAWATSDSLGYIVGGYNYAGNTGRGGKYLLALRKGPDGRWLIAADMDNSAGRP